MGDQITIEQFIEREKDFLARFEKNWQNEQREEPENFPSAMQEGEWQEQFAFYTEMLREKMF